jgi:hypothetical protein
MLPTNFDGMMNPSSPVDVLHEQRLCRRVRSIGQARLADASRQQLSSTEAPFVAEIVALSAITCVYRKAMTSLTQIQAALHHLEISQDADKRPE